jgi:hypothetical protein
MRHLRGTRLSELPLQDRQWLVLRVSSVQLDTMRSTGVILYDGPAHSILGLDADPVVDGGSNALLAAEVSRCRLK